MATKKKTSTKTASADHKSITDLKGMDRVDLMHELDSARRSLYVLTMKKELGELKQPHLITAERRYIAQISTFLTSAL